MEANEHNAEGVKQPFQSFLRERLRVIVRAIIPVNLLLGILLQVALSTMPEVYLVTVLKIANLAVLVAAIAAPILLYAWAYVRKSARAVFGLEPPILLLPLAWEMSVSSVFWLHEAGLDVQRFGVATILVISVAAFLSVLIAEIKAAPWLWKQATTVTGRIDLEEFCFMPWQPSFRVGDLPKWLRADRFLGAAGALGVLTAIFIRYLFGAEFQACIGATVMFFGALLLFPSCWAHGLSLLVRFILWEIRHGKRFRICE